MFVEQADQASTIPLFDETSAAVFACLCRLTDGDGRRALGLLVDVYVAAADLPVRSHSVASLTDSARRLYIGTDRSPTAIERVIADMHFVGHSTLAEIARTVDQPEDQVRTAVDALAAHPVVDPRQGEIWFDDVLRAEAQAAIADRLPHTDSSPTSIGRSRRRTGFVVGGAALVLLIALTVWVRGGGEADNGNTLPTASATTLVPITTTAPTTAPPTTGAEEVATTEAVNTDFTIPSDASTSEPTVDQGGFILDPPPSGYVGFGAGRYDDSEGTDPPYWVSIWSSDDAGPASGRWLALEVADEQPGSGLYRNGVQQRVEVVGRPALMSTAASGVQQLIVPLDDGKQLQIASYGVDAAQLAALVSATTIEADYVPTFGTDAERALDGLNLIASAPTHQSSLDITSVLRYDAGVHYQSPDTGSFISILSAPQAPNDLRIASLLVDASPSFPLSTSEVVSVDGRNVLIATVVYDDVHTYRVALWHAGARTISLSGELTIEDLVLAVRSSRPATADEWQALVDAEALPFPPQTFPMPEDVHTQEIGAATTTQGSSWTIRLSDADPGFGDGGTYSLEILHLSSPTAEASFQSSVEHQVPLHIDPSAPLTRFETPHATILIAAFDAPTEAASMRVTLYRRTPVDIPIVAVPDTALSGAAYVFSELVPYTVELIDANGAVLQTLAP